MSNDVQYILNAVKNLKPLPNSMVVVRYPRGYIELQQRIAIADQMVELRDKIWAGMNIEIIILPDNMSIESLSESDMERLGWTRMVKVT